MKQLNLDSAHIHELSLDSKGYLTLIGTIAKAGDLVYYNTDGSKRIERVPFETLKHPSHLESVVNGDFVLGHPDFINAENYKIHTIGSVSSNVIVNEDEESLLLEYVVKDADAIDKIRTKKLKGLSMAYFVKKSLNADGTFTQVTGTRSCDHHGLVENPRCKFAQLHLDSQDEITLSVNFDNWELPEMPEVKQNKMFFFIDNFKYCMLK